MPVADITVVVPYRNEAETIATFNFVAGADGALGAQEVKQKFGQLLDIKQKDLRPVRVGVCARGRAGTCARASASMCAVVCGWRARMRVASVRGGRRGGGLAGARARRRPVGPRRSDRPP